MAELLSALSPSMASGPSAGGLTSPSSAGGMTSPTTGGVTSPSSVAITDNPTASLLHRPSDPSCPAQGDEPPDVTQCKNAKTVPETSATNTMPPGADPPPPYQVASMGGKVTVRINGFFSPKFSC